MIREGTIVCFLLECLKKKDPCFHLWVLVCYPFSMGVRQSGSFPQSRVKPNKKLINESPPTKVWSSAPWPATHLPLLMFPGPPYIPTHLARITSSVIQEIPSRGVPRLALINRTAGLNSSGSNWFMSVSNRTSQVFYLLIDPMIIGALDGKWPLAKHGGRFRREHCSYSTLFHIMLKLELKSLKF